MVIFKAEERYKIRGDVKHVCALKDLVNHQIQNYSLNCPQHCEEYKRNEFDERFFIDSNGMVSLNETLHPNIKVGNISIAHLS